MKRNIKIYYYHGSIITEENSYLFCFGLFTNIKEFYIQFEPSTIHSYSTICNLLKKDGEYKIENPKLIINDSSIVFHEISIKPFITNTLYDSRLEVKIFDLLSKESVKFKKTQNENMMFTEQKNRYRQVIK